MPLPIRAAAGLLLALVAGRLPRHVGDPLLVVAVTLALPSLWFTGLSLLVGIVPLVAADRRARSERGDAGDAHVEPTGRARAERTVRRVRPDVDGRLGIPIREPPAVGLVQPVRERARRPA